MQQQTSYSTLKLPLIFSELSNQQKLVGFMVLALVIIFCGLGLRDPWPADEPRFALIAKEMVDTGQWFFPARAGEFYPDKPPIFMWSIALLYALTGSITFAFLLPSALCAMLTLYLLVDIGKKLWSFNTGISAGLLLLFSIQFTLQAKSAQIDAMVTCWITIGCYGLLRFMLFDGKWRWYYLAWFFMGIGVITKGVGFLPLLMLIPYFIYRKFKATNQLLVPINENLLKWLAGPVIMLLAIGLWFFPMLWLVHISDNPLLEIYKNNILFKQTVTRYSDSWHHLKPFWYYIVAVIPVFWLPISLLLPWLVIQWKKAIYQVDGRIILPLSWILLVVLFFSLSPGKRGVYVLPALPMLALISAPYLTDLLNKKIIQRLIWGLVLILSILILAFGIGGILELSFASKLADKFNISPWLLFISAGILGFICLGVSRSYRWLSWPSFLTVLWLIYSSWGYMLLDEVKTPKNVFKAMQTYMPEDAELALVDFSEQFIFFSPYPITHFGYHSEPAQQLRAAFAWQGENSKRFILIDKTLLNKGCYDQNRAISVGYAHRTDWVLLNVESKQEQCAGIENPIQEYHYKPVQR
ncbi:ArnT family glycosyltransferase [Glaciecola sp. 1036]|uniref:ArnT family glycosyltransferase n=1 Tax=Alteromonadaceae TaxID=72275 RepID=UPI003CFE7283